MNYENLFCRDGNPTRVLHDLNPRADSNLWRQVSNSQKNLPAAKSRSISRLRRWGHCEKRRVVYSLIVRSTRGSSGQSDLRIEARVQIGCDVYVGGAFQAIGRLLLMLL